MPSISSTLSTLPDESSDRVSINNLYYFDAMLNRRLSGLLLGDGFVREKLGSSDGT